MPGDIHDYLKRQEQLARPGPLRIGRGTYQPSVEDDMRAEIARLREQVATLKATLGMVRQVLAATVENIGSVA